MAKTTIKKKTTRKRKRKVNFANTVFLLSLITLLSALLYALLEYSMTRRLQRELAEVQAQKDEVAETNAMLARELEMLQDPQYYAVYARAEYHMSKQGEQVFYFPDKKE